MLRYALYLAVCGADERFARLLYGLPDSRVVVCDRAAELWRMVFASNMVGRE